MDSVIKVKSGSKYEASVSYSRAVAVGNLVFVSGTSGRNYRTRELPPSASEQTEWTLANIRRALEATQASLEDIVRLRIFVPRSEDVDGVAEVLGHAFRGIEPSMTFTCSPTAHPDLRVEIEATAVKGAAKLPVRVIDV
jgi:enamine deaminase RidA (YjgF/YER057c/UK114 family)